MKQLIFKIGHKPTIPHAGILEKFFVGLSRLYIRVSHAATMYQHCTIFVNVSKIEYRSSE